MKDFTRHTLCPLLAALIWGTAFTFQSICSGHLQTFTINAARNLIAAAVLIIFCIITKRPVGSRRTLVLGALGCGVSLFVAANLQQYGISVSSAGKAGFITALYIVIIPILGMFLNRPIGPRVWLAVGIAVVGMYFLCVTESLRPGPGDISLILCAFVFAVQMLFVDKFALLIDNVVLSASQFLVVGVLSLVSALIFGESASAADFSACLWPLLYLALFSGCIAYTLQIVGQRGGNPTLVALLLSLESVFAVIGGVVLLGEKMTGREICGCVLMLLAIVLAQLPEKKRHAAE